MIDIHMQPLAPVHTTHLFTGLHDQLLELLRSLPIEGWQRPTVCGSWTVHDIAAHMLDTQIRVISHGRDQWLPDPPERPLSDYQQLVGYLNHLNHEWVGAFRRVSPLLLTEFLALTGPALAQHVATLDSDAPAPLPVAWAGDEVSPNWFNIGRHYTEYWHHQQQIRDAVGATPLMSRDWLHPVLALFVRAVPHVYRDVAGPEGLTLNINIVGDAGGRWMLVRGTSEKGRWQLFEGESAAPAATVELSDDTAWRLFTNALTREEMLPRIQITGDRALGEVFFGVRSVMV